MLLCLRGRKWWIFLLSGILTSLAGIAAVLIWRIIVLVVNCIRFPKLTESAPGYTNEDQKYSRHERQDFLLKVKNWSQELLSGRSATGGSCTGSEHRLFHYLSYGNEKRICGTMSVIQGSFNRPAGVGLRCLRAINLLTIPIVLKYLNLLKTSRSIRLAEVISIFVVTVLTAAGMIHLLENSGDPFDFANSQSLSYWTCIYFVVITMSTVGFGDVFCITDLGRTFMCLFALIGPVVFIAFMMEILFYQTGESQRKNASDENDQRISKSTAHIQSDQSESQERNVINAIYNFIVENNLQLTIVERKSFKNLIETLSPGFNTPSLRVFTSKEAPIETIKADLKSIEYVSVSLRSLTSPDRVVILSVSFISSEWELECKTLASRKFNSNLTADNVSQFVCEILEKVNIPMDKISSVTTDADPELVEGVKDLGIRHIPCFAYIVKMFIDEIFSLKDIVVIMDKIDKIFNELKCSMEAQKELMIAQKELNVSHDKLLSYSENRCSTKLNRIDFVTTHEMAFRKFLTTYQCGKYSDLLITSIEYQKIGFLLNLLRPVEEYSKLLTEDGTITASLTNKLNKKISSLSHTTLLGPQYKTIVAKLLSAYPEGCYFELAEYFDPRISLDTEKLQSILVALKLDYQTLKRNKSALETLFDDNNSTDGVDEYQLLNDEFVLYNLRKKVSFDSNPLYWWKNMSETFPILSRICKKYLGIPAANTAAVITSTSLDKTSDKERLDFLPMNENIQIHSGLV